MKRNLFFYLLLCSLSIISLSSCNDDETIDYSPDIKGIYKGELNSFVEGDKQKYSVSSQIELSSDKANTINLVINNLSILTNAGYIDLGNIVVNNISVTPSVGELLYLATTSQKVDLGSLEDVTIEVKGLVNTTNNCIYLTINMPDTKIGDIELNFNSEAQSKSDKYDFESWTPATYKYGSTTVECREVNGFSSSNGGIAFVHASIEDLRAFP